MFNWQMFILVYPLPPVSPSSLFPFPFVSPVLGRVRVFNRAALRVESTYRIVYNLSLRLMTHTLKE